MKMKQKPYIFKLYPSERSSLYVRVHVWPTQKQLIDYSNKYCTFTDGKKASRHTHGTCGGRYEYKLRMVNGKKVWRMSGCFAEINFHRGRLGIGVITHEFFHALLRWSYRLKFDLGRLNSNDVTILEEKFAYGMTKLSVDFMNKALAAGIYGPHDLADG